MRRVDALVDKRARATAWRDLPRALMSVIFSYTRVTTALVVLPRVCAEWRALARAHESSPQEVELCAADPGRGVATAPIAHLRPHRLTLLTFRHVAATLPFLEPQWWRTPFLWRVRELSLFSRYLGPASQSPVLADTLRVLHIKAAGDPRPADLWTSVARFSALEELTAFGPQTAAVTPLPPSLALMLPQLRRLSCSTRYMPEVVAVDRLTRLLPALHQLELLHAPPLFVSAAVLEATAAARGATPLPLESLTCGARDVAALFEAPRPGSAYVPRVPRLRDLTVFMDSTAVAPVDLRHCTQLTALAFNVQSCPLEQLGELPPVHLPPSLCSLRIPTSLRVVRPWPPRLEELNIDVDHGMEEYPEWARWLAQHVSPRDASVGSVDSEAADIGGQGPDLAALRTLRLPFASADLYALLRRGAPLLQTLVCRESLSGERLASLTQCVAEQPALGHLALAKSAAVDATAVVALSEAAARRRTPLHLRFTSVQVRFEADEDEESLGNLSFAWLSAEFDRHYVRLPAPPAVVEAVPTPPAPS